jgi:type IV secretory pathway TraG/TraD family ATPase VirD4
MFAPLEGMFVSFGGLLIELVAAFFASAVIGLFLAFGLRLRGLRWSWSAVLLVPAALLGVLSPVLGLAGVGVCLTGSLVGMVLQSGDVFAGGDRAEIARARLGVLEAIDHAVQRWQASREDRGWLHAGHLQIGRDEHGRRVAIPAGDRSGSHVLMLGATGSGKTCGEAWIASRLIEHGHGAMAIDPKGDTTLRRELQEAAAHADRPFFEWTPQGSFAYNPYAQGSDIELADKALAGETFTEPHYLRQAQRYLGHAVRTMRAASVQVSALSLMLHMDPDVLEQTARELPEEQANAVQEYLDSLGERQRRELSGVRDRLSVLAESDIAPWLDPDRNHPAIDLRDAMRQRAVVYFALEADRHPLLAKMLGAAIVTDLISLAAAHQSNPIPTVVLIDEFAAIGTEHVASLFGRARSAGVSLLLATQELADLNATGHGALREQAIGNVETIIAYRQNVPHSAELLADIAGTRPAWITTQQTQKHLIHHRLTGLGTRTRGHEYTIHPYRIKQLRTGQALVITPTTGARPTITQVHHPSEARQ